MRRLLRGTVSTALLATVALVVVLGFGLLETGPAVDAYVLVLGAIALATAVRATRAAASGPRGEPELERALRRTPPTVERPRELARVERDVDLALGSAFYVHYRLRPLAREIATDRLESSRGIDLDGDQAAAREALSDDAWELVRPGRPQPRDPHGPGLSHGRLAALVDELEAL